MLVLTRKLKQQIQIGSNITITVLRVQGNSVRIGIEAPNSVRVLRAELPIQVDLEMADDERDEINPVKRQRSFATESKNPGEMAQMGQAAPLAGAMLRRRTAGATFNMPAPKLELCAAHGAAVAW